MSVSGVHNWLCFFINVAMTLVGMTGNGFIFISDCHNRIRSQTHSGSDLLLMSLSLTRFIFLGITLGFHCISFLDINQPKYAGSITIFFWTFFNATTLWITTCLGVFYCVRIVNFTQPFLVKMKLRISNVVPHLLVVVMLVSLFSALPFFWIEDHSQSYNNTEYRHEMMAQMFLIGMLYILGTFPSFVLFIISSGFLIYSLVHHAKRMQNNSVDFRDQRMDVHLKTIKILTSFLILYATTFVEEISMTCFPSPWASVMSIMVVSSYNSGRTVALIIKGSIKQNVPVSEKTDMKDRVWTKIRIKSCSNMHRVASWMRSEKSSKKNQEVQLPLGKKNSTFGTTMS